MNYIPLISNALIYVPLCFSVINSYWGLLKEDVSSILWHTVCYWHHNYIIDKKAIFALTHFSLKIKRLMLLNVFLLVFLWSSMWTDVGLTFCMPTFSILSPYIFLVFFGLIIVILRFKYDFSLLQLRKFNYNLYKGSINFLKWFDTLLRTWRILTTYEFSFIIFCYITSEKFQPICYQDI